MAESDGEQDQLMYFDETEGVIKVFEIDYDKVIDYQWTVANNNVLACIWCPLTWPGLPYHFICGRENLQDRTEAQHVCVTQDGIRYVVDRHKAQCRLDCQDEGKITKTIPFDKLTDCDVEEPAGADGPFCCLVNRTLTKVNIDTASGSRGADGEAAHELTINGLKDPHEFKSTVWKLKREGTGGAAMIGKQSVSAPSQMTMGAPEVVRLLQRQNELLEQIARNTSR